MPYQTMPLRDYMELISWVKIPRYEAPAYYSRSNAEVSATKSAVKDYSRRCNNQKNRTSFHRSGKRNSRNF